MTRQAAWEYYTRDVPRILDEAAAADGEDLTEEEALDLATEEVAEIRGRRGVPSPASGTGSRLHRDPAVTQLVTQRLRCFTKGS